MRIILDHKKDFIQVEKKKTAGRKARRRLFDLPVT